MSDATKPEKPAEPPKAPHRLQQFADYLTLIETTHDIRETVARLQPLQTFMAWNPYRNPPEREEFDKQSGTDLYTRLLEDLLRRHDVLVLGAEVNAAERMPAQLKQVEAPAILSGKGVVLPKGGKPR